MAKRHAGRGITLVEVLVLIGILGLLIALLLPELSARRETTRASQCMGKMKQLGLALQIHHDAHKKFPATSNQSNDGGVASVWWPLPGSGATTGAIPSAGYTNEAGTTNATAGYSWIVMILPYMNQMPLYDAISEASAEFTADAFTPYNVAAPSEDPGKERAFSVTTTVWGTTIKRHFAAVQLDQLACPSYAGTPAVAPSQYSGKPAGNPPAAYGYPSGSANLGSPPQFAAITNYVALSATHFPCMQYGPEPNVAATTDVPKGDDAPNGMIVPGTGLSMKACTDGYSKTMMLCETIEPAMNCWYDGTTTWTTAINPNSVAAFPPEKNRQGFWIEPDGGTTALNVGPAPTATIVYSPALAGYCATPQMVSWGPSSNHAGGIVVQLGVDGSVHGIISEVDPTVYMQIITIAGREPDAIPGMVP